MSVSKKQFYLDGFWYTVFRYEIQEFNHSWAQFTTFANKSFKYEYRSKYNNAT